ncbi:MAG: 50S ribosomal protein L25 [Elusimicrobia bacterium]|nr:50S ribosomal protein L25 [Elusimicrobiota bacterium]
MKEINVPVEVREKTGSKGVLSEMRRQKKIPGVIYGGEKPPVAIAISEKELHNLLKMGSNIVIKVEYSGAKDMAIIKEIQHHAVTNAAMSVDFQRISMKEKLEVNVPIKLLGEAPGVKEHGALIDHVLRELRVRCLPADMPHEIIADISHLNMGMSITVKDLKLPEGVESVGDPSRLIVHLFIPKEEVVAAPTVEGAEAVAAEPELIATKGKKEEEGAEGEVKPAAVAKPAAAVKTATPAAKPAAPGAKPASDAAKPKA